MEVPASEPVSPQQYGSGMNDAELRAAGWAAGLDVWGALDKAYGDVVGDGAVVNSQLWSLREAVRKQAIDELPADAEAHDVHCVHD